MQEPYIFSCNLPCGMANLLKNTISNPAYVDEKRETYGLDTPYCNNNGPYTLHNVTYGAFHHRVVLVFHIHGNSLTIVLLSKPFQHPPTLRSLDPIPRPFSSKYPVSPIALIFPYFPNMSSSRMSSSRGLPSGGRSRLSLR